MEENTFIFKGTKSLKIRIISSFVFLFGLLMMQIFLFGGIITTFGSIVLFATVIGIQIDFENKRYRLAIFFGNIPFGKWKELPELKYISVFKATYVATVRGLTNTGLTSIEKKIVLNLIHGRNRRLKVYITDEVDDAFEKAQYIAKKLNLKIYDATEKEGKWLS